MTLNEFRTLIRLYVPAAKKTRITNGTLDTLINKAVDDVNVYALAYKGNEKFNVVAEDAEYKWSSEITDFACLDESGIWWNDGTSASPEWKRMSPMTRKVLDAAFPAWKDDDSDDPLRYFLEEDNVTFHPTPETALTDGFWAFYVKVATAMTTGTHYPFTGSTVEITALRVLDDAIIDYVRWKLARPLGADQQGVLTERDYRTNLSEKVRLLKRRPDIMASPNNRMQGPIIN